MCRYQSPGTNDSEAIAVVPVDGGDTVATKTVLRRSVTGIAWGGNGHLYVWTTDRSAPEDIPAPEWWQYSAPALARRYDFRWVPAAEGRPAALYRFCPETGEDLRLPALADSPRLVVIQQELPTRDALLVTVYPTHSSPYSALLSFDGQLVEKLGVDGDPSSSVPVSVSPTGRYYVGFRSLAAGAENEVVQLVISDRVAGFHYVVKSSLQPLLPRFSHRDFLVAFTDVASGRVYVGTISLGR